MKDDLLESPHANALNMAVLQAIDAFEKRTGVRVDNISVKRVENTYWVGDYLEVNHANELEITFKIR